MSASLWGRPLCLVPQCRQHQHQQQQQQQQAACRLPRAQLCQELPHRGSRPLCRGHCSVCRQTARPHRGSSADRPHCTAIAAIPVPETEKERSGVDFPQEWTTPQPSKRPDTQPEFEKLETPLPKRMPGDPEQPDEEEEEEREKKKREQPDEDDPDKEEEEEEEGIPDPEKEKGPQPEKDPKIPKQRR